EVTQAVNGLKQLAEELDTLLKFFKNKDEVIETSSDIVEADKEVIDQKDDMVSDISDGEKDGDFKPEPGENLEPNIEEEQNNAN
ncbi:MAG: hypothetical protein GXW85_08565, partial [Clostridia bacterium]|nr:hypothetical protein [Clostridia bacterium]